MSSRALPRGLRFRLADRIGSKTYYGWVIVGVVFVSNLAAFGINPTFGLFIKPLELDLGWTRETISRSLTLGTVFGAVLSPVLGLLIDRWGVRTLMLLCGASGALFYFLLGFVQQPWQFNVLLGLSYAVLTAILAQMIGSVAISRWFVTRRGRAMGFMMMGASGGAMVFIGIDSVLLTLVGWRVTFMLHGLFTLLLCVVPTALLLINRPEDIGLGGHGELQSPSLRGAAPKAEVAWTLRQAVRRRAFWLTLGGLLIGVFSVQGYFVHAIPHMEANGISRGMASFAWGVFFFTGVVAKFIWGFLIEKLTVRWSLVSLYLWEAIGIQLLLHATTPTAVLIYAVLNGLGHGPFLQLQAMVWADYFGRKSIGSIMGTVQPIVVVFGALGPWLAGYVFDLDGNYTTFLNLGTVLCVGAAVVFTLDQKPGDSPAAAQG